VWYIIQTLFIILGITAAVLWIALYIYNSNSKKRAARPASGSSSYTAYEAKVLKITRPPTSVSGFVSFYVECSYVRDSREHILESRLISVMRRPFSNPSPDIECGVTVFVNEADPSDYHVEVRTRMR